jgi:hypothetical protein
MKIKGREKENPLISRLGCSKRKKNDLRLKSPSR